MAANGQKLRVAVTKTSAQGKSAQSAIPNLMSFSTDENSIWFNGKKYGVHVLKGFDTLNNDSPTSSIQSFLGDFTYDKWAGAADRGDIVLVTYYTMLIPALLYYDSIESAIQLILDTGELIIFATISYSTSSGYSFKKDSESNLLTVEDVVNNLTTTYTTSPLSAAMGKKLQDEKLAKTDVVSSLSDPSSNKALAASMGKKLQDEKLPKSFVVNNLTTTDTTKALSAAQGKKLNDAIDNIKIKIFESLSGREGDNVADVLGKFTDDWNMHPEKYIFYIKDDSEMCIAPCTVYYEANMRYLSYQVNGTIYEYDCEYDGNDICNLVGIYTFHATSD